MNSNSLSCRSCGSSDLERILDLGVTPLANKLITPLELGETEASYPLQLYFCNQCGLCQISETIPPEELFSNYVYFTSYSETMLNHCQRLVDAVCSRRSLSRESLVVDIASNDGYLLQYYQEKEIEVLGVEPAANIAHVAIQNGIPTIIDFFGEDLAKKMVQEGKKADVIHALNVFAHATDLNDFTAGLRQLIKPGGAIIIEVPYVLDLIENNEFDTIYHEHLCYFSVTSANTLIKRNGMYVTDVERTPIHGGSLRLWIGLQPEMKSGSLEKYISMEQELGMVDLSFYKIFEHKVKSQKRELVNLISSLKQQGKSIVAYGASAKGSTLLNYYQLSRQQIDYVVDISPRKQGLYTPGLQLPIYSPNKIIDDLPDYVLLLTWNIKDEILSQQSEYREKGGKFIIPIPEVTVV